MTSLKCIFQCSEFLYISSGVNGGHHIYKGFCCEPTTFLNTGKKTAWTWFLLSFFDPSSKVIIEPKSSRVEVVRNYKNYASINKHAQ